MFFDCINAEICLSQFGELHCDSCDMLFDCEYCSNYLELIIIMIYVLIYVLIDRTE